MQVRQNGGDKAKLIWTSVQFLGGGKSDGKVRVFRGKQPVSVQQLEAEDDHYTQYCVLEIENISSTRVFILRGSAGAGSCSNQVLGTGGPEERSQAKYLK